MISFCCSLLLVFLHCSLLLKHFRLLWHGLPVGSSPWGDVSALVYVAHGPPFLRDILPLAWSSSFQHRVSRCPPPQCLLPCVCFVSPPLFFSPQFFKHISSYIFLHVSSHPPLTHFLPLVAATFLNIFEQRYYVLPNCWTFWHTMGCFHQHWAGHGLLPQQDPAALHCLSAARCAQHTPWSDTLFSEWQTGNKVSDTTNKTYHHGMFYVFRFI